ncbi:hypothetical protein CANCADRAFT_58094 [Tortispora caseinolytica NRRL Y-17796]|uniref:RRM domain-containing protein n=1 Tax=Tortispora caseinolytica NRRL Y-17796 TaxID=767744 RepID=A0A1E4TBH5_9ASCO|nr:hypothetical protein CANCADRAFT_58094 [Tortispora caseinolytica NRRL Y-17796]
MHNNTNKRARPRDHRRPGEQHDRYGHVKRSRPAREFDRPPQRNNNYRGHPPRHSDLPPRPQQSWWNIKPEGLENISAAQAKVSGLFTETRNGLLEHPNASVSDILKRIQIPGVSVPSTLRPSTSRAARNLIISGFASDVTEQNLINAFNMYLRSINPVEGQPPRTTDPVVSASLHGSHLLLSLRTAYDATCVFALNGTILSSAGISFVVDVKRPESYIAPEPFTLVYSSSAQSADDLIAKYNVPESPTKICISQLPEHLSDSEVKQLFNEFMPFDKFLLLKSASDSNSSLGTAFIDLEDEQKSSEFISKFNNYQIENSNLIVQYCCRGTTQTLTDYSDYSALQQYIENSAASPTVSVTPSRVLVFFNMINPDDLTDQELVSFYREDIKKACEKYGEVISVNIPQPLGIGRENAALGRVYVEFKETAQATLAIYVLSGFLYNDRTVIGSFYPEKDYEVGAL